jgi:hypothetical protein
VKADDLSLVGSSNRNAAETQAGHTGPVRDAGGDAARGEPGAASGRLIEAFGARLRDQVDLDTLTAEVLAVVDQAMPPTQASLWLRPQGLPNPIAARGGGARAVGQQYRRHRRGVVML